ncbi:MAG: hypothetical protein CL811_12575 [Colwelliaceae bacterium]|nr:hypothetical protein [Colwelliaceae bacterium]
MEDAQIRKLQRKRSVLRRERFKQERMSKLREDISNEKKAIFKAKFGKVTEGFKNFGKGIADTASREAKHFDKTHLQSRKKKSKRMDPLKPSGLL